MGYIGKDPDLNAAVDTNELADGAVTTAKLQDLAVTSAKFGVSGAVSSSAQIATVISGSLGTNASVIRSLTAAVISGSANAANISGSLGTNATLIRSLTAANISGSFEGGGSTKISGSSTSTGSFGSMRSDGLVLRPVASASAPQESGSLVYDSTDKALRYYTGTSGSAWAATGNKSFWMQPLTGNFGTVSGVWSGGDCANDATTSHYATAVVPSDFTALTRVDLHSGFHGPDSTYAYLEMKMSTVTDGVGFGNEEIETLAVAQYAGNHDTHEVHDISGVATGLTLASHTGEKLGFYIQRQGAHASDTVDNKWTFYGIAVFYS